MALWPETRALVERFLRDGGEPPRTVARRSRRKAPPEAKPRRADGLVVPKEVRNLKKMLPEPPELVRPWRGPWPSSMIVDSDLHHDVHCARLEAAKLKFAADRKVEHWLNLGDTYDFESISRFAHDPERAGRGLQAEFDSALPYWREAARITKGRVDFILGNHEERLRVCLASSGGLFHLSCLADFGRIAGLPAGVTVHPYGSHVQVGPAWGEHGDRTKGQNPTFWAMNHRGARALFFGHTHKKGMYWRTLRSEDGQIVTRVSSNTGHGCDASKARYAGGKPNTNWQLGFDYVETYQDRHGVPQVIVHPIVAADDGSFSYGGRVYRG